MIQIITEQVEMPKLDDRRFQKNFVNNKWQVVDTQNKNQIVYQNKFENVSIACHNLNKKFYLEKQNPK